jgi:hypothetical protein
VKQADKAIAFIKQCFMDIVSRKKYFSARDCQQD